MYKINYTSPSKFCLFVRVAFT